MSGPFSSRGSDESRSDQKLPGDQAQQDYDFDDLDAAKSSLEKNLRELAQSYEALDYDRSDSMNLFVDLDSKIRHISASAQQHLNLNTEDYGLPVSDFARRMGYPDLSEQIRSVLEQPQIIENEIKVADGRRFNLRIAPDRRTHSVQGALLRFDPLCNGERLPGFLEKLVLGHHDAALLLSAELKVLLANARFYQDFQLKREQTVGRLLQEIGEGEWSSPSFNKLLTQLLAEGQGRRSMELTQSFPNVGERSIKLNACHLGENGWILVAIRDLNLERQLETAREREAQLQWELQVRSRLQKMASDVLQSNTPEAMFQSTLDAAVELTQADASLLQVVEGGDLQVVAQRGFDGKELEYFLDVAARRDIASFRSFRKRQQINISDILNDEAYTPLQSAARSINLRAIQSTPLIGRSGRLMGVLSIIYCKPRTFASRDSHVSDLLAVEIADLCEWVKNEKRVRQNETRLRAQSEQLLANDRQKNQFLALLGHELRNPLTVMRNSIQTLVAEPALTTRPRSQEALTLLERQSRHMTHLVNDLLDITRINNGKVVLKRERVLLSRCLDEVMGAHRSTLQARQLHYRIVSPERSIFIDADAARLFQVLDNLITNAIKFTEPGGFIEIASRVVEDKAEIRVSDTGIGISPDAIAKLFDPFTQVDNSLACHGLGLGLSLVKSLVDLHGGSIRAHSEGEDQGSEFLISWPLHPRQDDSETEVAPPRLHLEPTHSRRRILVVDDIADIANSFARLLEVAGHEVFVAYNAQEALELARAHQPSVAFLDMIMPETDGLELARLLRKEFNKDELALVMVSGYGQSEDIQRAHQAGFDHHLLKPIEVQQVYNLLDKINGISADEGP